MLFREQGITIASILTAIGMAISVLVEALLPGGEEGGNKLPPKDKKDLKEWVRNKQSLGKSAREIRHENSRSFAWHHWSDYQLLQI